MGMVYVKSPLGTLHNVEEFIFESAIHRGAQPLISVRQVAAAKPSA